MLERLDPSATVRDALDTLPGGIVVAILAVRMTEGGPPEWLAGLVVVAVVHRTDSILAGMTAGIGAVLAVRSIHP